MKNFSVMHKLHRLEMLLYADARDIIFQLVVKSILSVFNFQMYLDNSVAFFNLLLENEALWLAYLVLNGPSVTPI